MKAIALAAVLAVLSCARGDPKTLFCGSSVSGSRPADGPPPVVASGLKVPSGLRIERIANVPSARELAFAPDGDLFVGTTSSNVYIVPNADGKGNAGRPHQFASVPDGNAAGIAFHASSCTLYIGAETGVFRTPFRNGDLHAASPPIKIASVRTFGEGGHSTTSVAVTSSTLYASVGSTCNACTESDPTRATIQQMGLDGGTMHARAIRIRNAVGLTVNPNTGTLWAGDAGQDALPDGHPFEFFDPVTLHHGVADYGWPGCEENHNNYGSGANCSRTVQPLVEFPAYSTIIGAVFASSKPGGAFALPSSYAGGAFITLHGSWHRNGGVPVVPPRVAFVSMRADRPARSVNWSNPNAQWVDFVSGFQSPNGSRIGRPAGVAIGPQGDLFFADDDSGAIYRVRP